MGIAKKRTFSLPPVQSEYIDELVASGTYGSGSEVIPAGLRALQERDVIVERWLREEVASAYDAIEADRGRAISMEDAFGAVRAPAKVFSS